MFTAQVFFMVYCIFLIVSLVLDALTSVSLVSVSLNSAIKIFMFFDMIMQMLINTAEIATDTASTVINNGDLHSLL